MTDSITPGSKGKVVLAYSGGLDTSCLIPWLMDKGYDVVTAIADVGQPNSDIAAVAEKAKAIGAIASYDMDLREEFCEEYCTCAIKANGLYENEYPLLSALSRPVICKHLVDIAHKEGAVAIAHGCTGKGNDQVRFTLECTALDPDLQILGPVRDWELTTRNSEFDYAEAHGVPLDGISKEHPYSIDENCWGRAIECGTLENPWNNPPADTWEMTVNPTDAPDEPCTMVISFEAGKPVALDGKKIGMFEMITSLNKLAGGNGYGRLDLIEDRLVGLKSRECYEQPAALVLIKAHKALESLCLPGDLLATKLKLEHDWAKQVYTGQWFTPLKDACDTFFDFCSQTVTGDVRLTIYKGSIFVDGLRSEHSMYDFGLATYDEGDTFDRTTAAGFMELFGLPNKVWAQRRINPGDPGMPEATNA